MGLCDRGLGAGDGSFGAGGCLAIDPKSGYGLSSAKPGAGAATSSTKQIAAISFIRPPLKFLLPIRICFILHVNGALSKRFRFALALVPRGHFRIGEKSTKAGRETRTKAMSDFTNFRPSRLNATEGGKLEFSPSVSGSSACFKNRKFRQCHLTFHNERSPNFRARLRRAT